MADNNIGGINLGKKYAYPTAELRMAKAANADPLQLYYKLLINFDAKSGLFADENYVDSALAYLNRIGENGRYELLKIWIGLVKELLGEYEFLFLEVEGLDDIQNHKPQDSYIEEEAKVTFTLRETSDMRVQALLTTYREIWFDNTRGVEVLPSNLRKFDASILVYGAGYYNMDFYDDLVNSGESQNRSIETLIYPTLRKISQEKYGEFNHQLYIINSCSINNDDSGKSFASTVANEASGDFVKNTICFNYRFASYKGRFNNLIGNFDVSAILAILAANNRKIAIDKNSAQTTGITPAQATEKISTSRLLKKIFSKDTAKVLFKAAKKEAKYQYGKAKDTVNTRLKQIPNKILGANTPIGEAVNNFTNIGWYGMMIKNTFDLGLDYVQETLVDKPITQMNNKIFGNFSNDIYTAYKNLTDKPTNKTKLVNDISKQITGDAAGNIKLGNDNVYSRKGF